MNRNHDWPGLGSTVAERLQWLRAHRGYTSPRNAATVLGIPLETYRKHESGERGASGLKDHHVKRYARVFQANAIWIQTGQGAPFGVSAMQLTPEEIRVIEALRAARK